MVTLTVVLIACIAPVIGQEPNLKQLARANNGSGGNVISIEYPVMTARQLLADADLVLRATVESTKALLNPGETKVDTEYELRPIESVTARRSHVIARPGQVPIIVRRPGGEVILDGLRLSTRVDAFPEEANLRSGDEGVFFLKYDADKNVYSLVDGPFGVFRITSGKVGSLTADVASRRGDTDTSPAAFMSELRKLSEVDR